MLPVVTRMVHASFLLQQLSQTRTLVFHPCSGTGFRLSEHLLHTADPQPRHWNESEVFALVEYFARRNLLMKNSRDAFECLLHCERESFECFLFHCLVHDNKCQTDSCRQCCQTLVDKSHILAIQNLSPNSRVVRNPWSFLWVSRGQMQQMIHNWPTLHHIFSHAQLWLLHLDFLFTIKQRK